MAPLSFEQLLNIFVLPLHWRRLSMMLSKDRPLHLVLFLNQNANDRKVDITPNLDHHPPPKKNRELNETKMTTWTFLHHLLLHHLLPEV